MFSSQTLSHPPAIASAAAAAAATLVDVVGTAALYTVSSRGGVSLNINVNYLRPIPTGGEAVITAKVVKLGRSIATIEVAITDGEGEVAATGTHVKFLTTSHPGLPDQLLEEERQRQQQRGTSTAASHSGCNGSSAAQSAAPLQARL